VTDRFRSFQIMDTTVHQVGMPWCFGWQHPADGSGGDSANLLVPFMGDPNTLIPESKAFMVNIAKLAEPPAEPPAAKTMKSTGR
jgi:formate dehydrogenase major subunit